MAEALSSRAALLFALFVLACAREQQKPQVVPQRCDGLCGRVADARTKQPIREFTVYVMTNRSGVQIALPPGYPHPPGMMIDERVIASNDGSFVLRAPEHPVILMISARGYNGFTTQEVDGSQRIAIELTRARQIPGHVADERGHPIANAHVSETMSDANGNFTIDEPPGEWRQLDVSDDEHLPSRLIVHQSDTRIDVTLHDAAETQLPWHK